MNKKGGSLIIIITTLISISVMLNSDAIMYKLDLINKKTALNMADVDRIKNQININEKKVNSNTDNSENEKNNFHHSTYINGDEEKGINNDSINKTLEFNESIKKSSSKYEINAHLYDEYLKNKRREIGDIIRADASKYHSDKEEIKSVFKVSTKEIKKNLTFSDKLKLLNVSRKLNSNVYNKVEEYLYYKDAEVGIIKALKLLKENLPSKDYNNIREIAEKYINMELVENTY